MIDCPFDSYLLCAALPILLDELRSDSTIASDEDCFAPASIATTGMHSVSIPIPIPTPRDIKAKTASLSETNSQLFSEAIPLPLSDVRSTGRVCGELEGEFEVEKSPSVR